MSTDLDFATVQRVGLDAGLVDNKSVVADDFQGLQFVYRLKDRQGRADERPSGRRRGREPRTSVDARSRACAA